MNKILLVQVEKHIGVFVLSIEQNENHGYHFSR